jgi:SAM-dependent methyltransferase
MIERRKVQRWAPKGYIANAAYVAELGLPVVDLLAPKPGERILDLGCGDGRLTEHLAALGAVVVGVDASAEMLAAARAKGLDVVQADARELPFHNEFDAVFSNAALHWVPDAEAVIAGVSRALKPGGRFVGEFGGHGNVAAIATALRAVLARRGIDGQAVSPWYYPTREDYAARLAAGGFEIDRMDLFPRPTQLPTDMTGWLATFAGAFLGSLPAAEQEAAVAETVALLAPSLRDERGRWTVDYVRLRFRARRL